MLTGVASAARLTAVLRYATALATVAVVLLVFSVWRKLSPPAGPHSPSATRHSPLTTTNHAWQGVTSCSAMPCHHSGAPVAAPAKEGNEFAVWFYRDPHSRAFEVLTKQLAKDISRRLRQGLGPHDDPLCLRCHVDREYEEAKKNPRFSLRDGVGCESCHGPAQKWLTRHYRKKELTESQRREGMHDTGTLAGRIGLCLNCHVGNGGQDVNHDLIAAGHPALRFDFAAYHAALPHHWNDQKDDDREGGRPQFDARARTLGELAAAQAALCLLAERASATDQPWPEFAEYHCASCHHDLQVRSRRPARLGIVPGSPLWDTRYVSTLPAAWTGRPDARAATLAEIGQLRNLLDMWNPPRETAAKQARNLAGQLKKCLAER